MGGQNSTSKKNNMLNKCKDLTIWEALIPVIALIFMLFYNVFYVFGDDALSGSNQFILLLGAAIAAIIGCLKKVKYKYEIIYKF